MMAVILYCSQADAGAESLQRNCNANLFIRSSPSKLAEHVQELLDKPGVISINNGERQW